MTKEEAWLVWIRATKTSGTPVETDFEIIRKTSWWAAFEAGWDAAAVNLNGWDQAYFMGVQAGKNIAEREWVGLATGEAREFYESDLSREELIHKIDEFLQEKNT